MPDEPQVRPRRKGPRPKHIPLRTCVVCRDKDAKRDFVRLVRTTDGAVEIDRTGKKNGRGAYLCTRLSCWERAATGDQLERALRVDVPQGVREALLQFGREHFRPDEPATNPSLHPHPRPEEGGVTNESEQ